MNDEHNGGSPQGDDAFGGPEEVTAVELGGDYVLGAGRRSAFAMHEAGRAIDHALDVVAGSPPSVGILALEEVADYLERLAETIAGTARAFRRIIAYARKHGFL